MKQIVKNLIFTAKQDANILSYTLLISGLTILTLFNFYYDFEDSMLDKHHNTLFGFVCYAVLYVGIYFGAMLCMVNNEKIKLALTNPKFIGTVVLALLLICFNKNYDVLSLKSAGLETYERYFYHKWYSQINTFIVYSVSFLLLGVVLGKLKYKGFGLWNIRHDYRLYFILLAMMVPFLWYASTHDSFLRSYPRLNTRPFPVGTYIQYFMKYEPIYLLNFIGLEWLFRGFMVLGIMKYCGSRSVILIATIYCVFHFGKPMAECISSFFGGYILGMITYSTRTIWGGVILHMGVALFMDLFALMQYM